MQSFWDLIWGGGGLFVPFDLDFCVWVSFFLSVFLGGGGGGGIHFFKIIFQCFFGRGGLCFDFLDLVCLFAFFKVFYLVCLFFKIVVVGYFFFCSYYLFIFFKFIYPVIYLSTYLFWFVITCIIIVIIIIIWLL
jgi:hypothetical protein